MVALPIPVSEAPAALVVVNVFTPKPGMLNDFIATQSAGLRRLSGADRRTVAKNMGGIHIGAVGVFDGGGSRFNEEGEGDGRG